MSEDADPVADLLAPRPRNRGTTFGLSVLAVVLCAVTLVGLYAVYFRPDPWPETRTSRPAAQGERLTSKLLVVVADSVRRSAMEVPELSPFFHEMGSRGIQGVLTVPGPSLTGVSVVCFGTGIEPPIKTAMTNFVVPEWQDEHVFSLIHEAGARFGFFGDDTWQKAFGRHASWHDVYPFTDFYGEFPNDWYPKDHEILESIHRVIDEERWNCLVVHFSTTDKLAHRYGAGIFDPDTRLPTTYARAITNIDLETQKFFRAAGSDTTVVLLSDHGCTASGTHGSFDLETREVRFAAAGPGIRHVPGETRLDAVELAPLLCRLLGARAPRCAEAALRTELLELDPAEATSALEVNLAERLAFTRDVARVAGLDWSPESSKSATNEARDAEVVRVEFTRLVDSLAGALRDSSSRLRLIVWIAVAFLLVTVWALIAHVLERARIFPSPQTWRSRLVGLTPLAAVAALIAWRQPYYKVMDLTARIFDASPFYFFLTSVIMGTLIGRGTRRLGEVTRRHVSQAVLLAVTFMPVLWPYGPVLPAATFVLLTTIFAIDRGDSSRYGVIRGRIQTFFGVIALFAVTLYSRAHIDFDTESLFRVVESSAQTIVAAAGAALLLVIVVRSTPKNTVSRRMSALCILLIAAAYVFGELAHRRSDVGHARIALAATAAAFLCVLRADFDPRSRCAWLIIAHVALFRLFSVDANVLALLPFALGAIVLMRSPMFERQFTPWRAVTILVVADLVFYFAQGYHYALSAFDMNTAFVLVRGAVDLRAATAAIGLQQYVPAAIVTLALMGTAAATGTRVRQCEAFAALMAAQATRIGVMFLLIPFREDEGWLFLRAVHAVAFESVKLGMMVAAGLLVAGARWNDAGAPRTKTT